jgi:DNA-binding Lrp family transcriptional regulator
MDNQPITTENQGSSFLVLKFADSKIPLFKETKDRKFIKYGEDNSYPEYLLWLYNKSAKHNSIINGKSKYIFGEGYENGDVIINRLGETLNDIAKKCIKDVEIFGGYYLEIIWGRGGRIVEVYHVQYNSIRIEKNGDSFYYKESWKKYSSEEDAKCIPAFNPKMPIGSQIYQYREYRPGVKFYPLPGFIGCNNYIETDIEIGKFYLSGIRNGMNPSKMIQFFKGDPTPQKKEEVENGLKKKYTGSENTGSIIVVWNNKNEEEVKVTDLSGSDLDKMFIELNKTTQQEIFSGHNVTSPMLFGIKTEGQLGGNTELEAAYLLFQNTYSKPKAEDFDKEINYLLSYSIFANAYELRPSSPISIQIDIKDVIQELPRDFVLDKLGVPKEMWSLPSISGLTPSVAQPIATNPAQQSNLLTSNENIKNLSAKQNQQMLRTVRQYKKGIISEAAARMLLKGSLGLTDEDVNALLDIPNLAPAKMEKQEFGEDVIIGMFDACGEESSDFEVIKSKKISFQLEEDDEEIYKAEAFATVEDLTNTEAKILDLIKKDKRITADVIAKAIGQTKAYVESKLKNFEKRGIIEAGITMVGEDEIMERTINKTIEVNAPAKDTKKPKTEIFIKYSYEGPKDDRNRPFCAKMMQLNRLYSRAEIESISQRLGYSVFDRRGGFWNTGGKTLPHCRHKWVSNIVVKKK